MRLRRTRDHVSRQSVRGRSATDGTIQQLMQLNSIFSHAFDFQRKAFFAPIIVKGPAHGARVTGGHR